MKQFTFKNAGYLFAGASLSQDAIAQDIATASPKFHTLKSDDPIVQDIKAGILQRKAEFMPIDAFMIYNKDSQSYITVDEAKYKAHKGDKFHRTASLIVSSITNSSEYSKLSKDKAKQDAYKVVREPLRMYMNTTYGRLESRVKAITDPKPDNGGSEAQAFALWTDDLLKKIKARRKTSEQRSDLVPSEKWLNDEIITPMQTKLKDWYAKNSK